MKITLPIPALAAILGLALAGVPVSVQAQNDTGTTMAGTAAPAKTKKTKYSGLLTAVDVTANTITLNDPTGAPITVTITSATKIKKDGKMATLSDFQVGDKVGGSYTLDAAGQMAANSLYTGKKPGTKAPATATMTAAPATPAAQ